MIEYLNFFLFCTLLISILYLYVRVKKYLTLLKMADETLENLVSGVSYEAPQSLRQSDSKDKNFSNVFLLETVRYFWVKPIMRNK